MGLIFFVLIILAAWWALQNFAVLSLCKGKTEEQKKVIKYLYGGFLVLGKINDQQYDDLVAKKVAELNLRQKAIAKIGLDEDQISEISPVNFQGYDCSEAVTKSDLGLVYYGKHDSKLRSTQYESVWLFFSDTQVYMYKYHFDMISDNKKVNTEEYFYRDITNFSTQAETVEAFELKIGCTGKMKLDDKKKKNKEYSQFGLIVPGANFFCSTTNSSNVDESISAMKQKLREKKNA